MPRAIAPSVTCHEVRRFLFACASVRLSRACTQKPSIAGIGAGVAGSEAEIEHPKARIIITVVASMRFKPQAPTHIGSGVRAQLLRHHLIVPVSVLL